MADPSIMKYIITINAAIFMSVSILFAQSHEPTNAAEAAVEKASAEAKTELKYQAWLETLSPEAQEWEAVLQRELGSFYLPIHMREKVQGRSNAWDFVKDDPNLPRVLLIGDSVSRAYTQTVRKELEGKANVHRAPANCGPTAAALNKMDVWLGEGKWDIIHFNFGIHDRNTPLADYRQRLGALIERMNKTGATLIWASSTPLPDVAGKWTAASMIERNAAAAKIMEKHGVKINDLHSAIRPRLRTPDLERIVRSRKPVNKGFYYSGLGRGVMR
jgi:hypothetical protein